MGNYTSSIFVAIPESMLPIGAPIARAFDPDTGGDKSFEGVRATKDGVTYAICYTPAVPATVAGLAYFQATPGALHGFVMQDYEARWGELTPPTVEECEEFRTNIVLQTGMSFAEALEASGMTLVAATDSD